MTKAEPKQDNTKEHYLSELSPFIRKNHTFDKNQQLLKETAEKNYNKPTEYAFLIFPLLAILDGNLMIGWLKKTYILRFKNK